MQQSIFKYIRLMYVLYFQIYIVVDDKKLRQEVKPRITDLQNVADSKAVRKWKAICRELGVTEDEIAQAETAHIAASTGPSEAFMEALLNWRDKNGHEAKVSVLASVLEKCGCKEVATQLKLVLQQNAHSTCI